MAAGGGQGSRRLRGGARSSRGSRTRCNGCCVCSSGVCAAVASYQLLQLGDGALPLRLQQQAHCLLVAGFRFLQRIGSLVDQDIVDDMGMGSRLNAINGQFTRYTAGEGRNVAHLCHFAADLKDRCVAIDDQWLGHYVRGRHKLGALPFGLVHYVGHLATGGAAGLQRQQIIAARRPRIGLLHFKCIL